MNTGPNEPKPHPLQLEYRTPTKRAISGFAAKCLAFLGIALSLLLTARVFLASPPRGVSGRRANRDELNLQNIGLARQIYGSYNGGRFPASFEELYLSGVDLTPDVFIGPCTDDVRSDGVTPAQVVSDLSKGGHCSYTYVGKGLVKNIVNPAKVAVAFNTKIRGNPKEQGIEIVYADGHVMWQPGTSVESILAAATRAPIFPTTRP